MEIPLLVRGQLTGTASGAYIVLGPSLGIRVNAQTEVTSVRAPVLIDEATSVAPYDFSLVAGLGVAGRRFGIEGRAGVGVTNAARDPGDQENRVLTILARVRVF